MICVCCGVRQLHWGARRAISLIRPRHSNRISQRGLLRIPSATNSRAKLTIRDDQIRKPYCLVNYPMIVVSIWTILLLSVTSSGVTHENEDIPLNEWPMLMSHDSGTGYISKLNPFWKIAKVQEGGFAKQLDCGVRAFDLRFLCNTAGLYMHHGILPIIHSFTDALKEVKTWASAHPQELILLINSHYSPNDDHCRAKVWQAMASLGLMTPIGSDGSCDKLQGLSVRQAKAKSKLEEGGNIFVVEGEGKCLDANWNPKLTCYRQNGDCRRGSPGSDVINKEMLSYINETASHKPTSNHLATIQALWQYDVDSVGRMLAAGSNILKDSQLSGLHKELVDVIPQLKYVNLLEVDDACFGGPELLKALRTRRSR